MSLQLVIAFDLLRKARNHMAEQESYEEAVSTEDLVELIDEFILNVKSEKE